MNIPISSIQISPETENTEPVQFFESESVAITPGTKVCRGRPQGRFGTWILLTALSVISGLIGLVAGWLIFG